jgi:hypothetical protein
MNGERKTFGVLAQFASPEELLHAVRLARDAGYRSLDAFTPLPVHGLDKALGLERSKLGFVVFAGGLLGAAAALLLQWWTAAVDYPLKIGGKPYFHLEFSIPVTFELTVLFAAFGAVLGMLAFNRLPQLYHPVFTAESFRRATDDGFLLLIESRDPQFEPEACRRLLESAGAARIEVVEEAEA